MNDSTWSGDAGLGMVKGQVRGGPEAEVKHRAPVSLCGRPQTGMSHRGLYRVNCIIPLTSARSPARVSKSIKTRTRASRCFWKGSKFQCVCQVIGGRWQRSPSTASGAFQRSFFFQICQTSTHSHWANDAIKVLDSHDPSSNSDCCSAATCSFGCFLTAILIYTVLDLQTLSLSPSFPLSLFVSSIPQDQSI